MKTHVELETKTPATAGWPLERERAKRQLRQQAETLGLPAFVLKLAAARRILLIETENAPRFRHD